MHPPHIQRARQGIDSTMYQNTTIHTRQGTRNHGQEPEPGQTPARNSLALLSAACGAAHLSLGGMNVDVQVPTGHGNPQVDEGVCVLGQDIFVGRLHRLLDGSALDKPIVDEEDKIRSLGWETDGDGDRRFRPPYALGPSCTMPPNITKSQLTRSYVISWGFGKHFSERKRVNTTTLYQTIVASKIRLKHRQLACTGSEKNCGVEILSLF